MILLQHLHKMKDFAKPPQPSFQGIQPNTKRLLDLIFDAFLSKTSNYQVQLLLPSVITG